MEIENLSALELSEAIQSKKLSCEEVASFFLHRIEKYNSQLNAVIEINQNLLEQARKIDQQGLKGLPLEGIPVLFKDMFCTQGIKTTAASKILQNFIPPYSATVVEKLFDSGALILGKCNQDEFAMGCNNETSFFGHCKNPWNTQYSPGGSSGGSAATVAASFAPVALGTDTGGSVRQPSHYCNLFGIKPTYGRISRYGIISYASSLDQAGVLSRKVEDGALFLSLISGKDEKDSTTSSQKVLDWSKNLNPDIKNLKIGWVGDALSDVSDVVLESYELAKQTLQKTGAEFKSVKLPFFEHAISIYYLISSSEASSNLARYDGIKYGSSATQKVNSLKDFYSQTRSEGFGQEVKRRILMGTFCLSQGYFEAYFKKAQKVRRLIKNEFETLFKDVDILLTPVTSDACPRIGSQKQGYVKYYSNDSWTVLSNLAGLPSASVPVGIFNGLPLGVQIIAPHFDEQTLFNVAYFLQEELQSYKSKPNLEIIN